MKNLAIFGLAAASVSMAAGSLWNMDVDAYQVQVPETVACDKTGDDYGAACYQSTGGWWFAYVGDTKDGQEMSFDPIDFNTDGGGFLTDVLTGDNFRTEGYARIPLEPF